MNRRLLRSALAAATVVVIGLSVGPGMARAQVYRWTDGDGTINYSQGIESVPVRFRAAAVIIGYDRPGAVEAPAPPLSPAVGSSVARLRFTPGQPIMVTARINGTGTAELMLDTGATRTVINPKVLEAVGVSYRDAQRGSLRGVTGDAPVLAVQVDRIDVGGAAHGPLMVVSHDTGFGRGDGLLGRDFLDQFTVTIDNGAGIVTLTPR